MTEPHIVLPHTGLHVPHTRLRVSSLKTLRTPDGEAFIATLRLDGRIVGHIHNDGNGGATTLTTTGTGFSWRDLDAFVAACRTDAGSATLEEHILDDLVDEHDFGRIVAAATDRGGTVARLLDRRGLTVAVHVVAEVPDSYPVRDALGRQLVEEYHHAVGEQWVLWTGYAWRFLTLHTS